MIKILTSDFPEGFPEAFAEVLKTYICKTMKLAFVASEFEEIYEKTDWYCDYFLKMFAKWGITFECVKVVDGRMSAKLAQTTIKEADVIWLSGGDTPKQYTYLNSYGLLPCIRQHKGIIIGMSAGSINMAKTAICTLTCGHNKQEIYEGLGLVDFSIEPHLDKENISTELLELSETYQIYGMCDNSAIICKENKTSYLGDVFLIDKQKVTQI